MSLSPNMNAIRFVTLSFLINAATAVKIYRFAATSSCAGADTALWRRGSGAPIKSWVGSINPNEGNRTLAGVRANFTLGESSIPYAVANDLGLQWVRYGDGPLDGWLYNEELGVEPANGDRVAFVYPDFKTVLFGKFRDNLMVEARETTITAHRSSIYIHKRKIS